MILKKGIIVETVNDKTKTREMTEDEKHHAVSSIQTHISDFDYDMLIREVQDETGLKIKFASTTVGYEKIQLFRLIREKHDDDVITKFINEAFHIENEYVMQLNPHKFESVPEYVVRECERLLESP